jgi:NAD(P)H-quinone oxidoreductase subunit 5
MALVLFLAVALLWGMDLKTDISLLLIGSIIIMGLSRIFTAAIAGKWNLSLLTQAAALALIVTVAFFVLESATHTLVAQQIPEIAVPHLGRLIAIGLILLAFGTVVFIQLIASQLSQKPAYRALAIHVRNGFYANAFFDRLVGAYQIHSKVKTPEV